MKPVSFLLIAAAFVATLLLMNTDVTSVKEAKVGLSAALLDSMASKGRQIQMTLPSVSYSPESEPQLVITQTMPSYDINTSITETRMATAK